MTGKIFSAEATGRLGDDSDGLEKGAVGFEVVAAMLA